MALLQRKQRGSRPPARGGPSRRKRRAPESSHGAPADDRYGPRRLRALYEISKLLTHFVEDIEESVLALLAIMNQELPLQSGILIEKANGEVETIVWHAPNTSPADRGSAEAHALKSFTYLTEIAAPPVKAIKAKASLLSSPPAGDIRSGPAQRGKFITCPLTLQGRRIFGALHVEGVDPFDEEDVEFVSAIANQLAIALDRHHARLHEIALRKAAESSQRQTEQEMAGRRRVEEEMRELNEDLERRVTERTSQFLDTIKELHAFTYSIAHDLRAPLRHIHGFSQLLLGSADDAARKKYSQRIMATTKGMDVLIKDLLAYSRLTLEEVKCGPVSLSAVLAKIRVNFKEDLRQHKARLEIEEPVPRVIGHEGSLIQAITNLISNALKFAAPGVAPRILIKAEVRGDRVRLWVEDNGIGIAPEHQERIFGVFQRLHKVEDYPGTGIGLAIVRRALERMKGRSGVESQLGQGSKFWIELERAPENG